MPVQKYPPTGKYIDPLVDFAFKKIFGSEPNKDLLIDFLNEIFRGRKVITDLTYCKNEHPGNTAKEGGAIFDLMCTGSNGGQFIIEVQRSHQEYFKERALFYTSRLISGQARKGGRNKWAYQLKEVYLIALLDGFTLEDTQPVIYIHDIALCDRDTGNIFYDKLGYTYIELPNFTKTESELTTELDKWLYVLKHLSTMKKLPAYLRKPIFKKLFSIAAYSNMTKEEAMKYDESQKRRWDDYAVTKFAEKQGMKKGMEQGLAQGINIGIEKGIEKGIDIGRIQMSDEKARTIALALKKEGLSSEFIAKTTGLSIEEVDKL